ncbi:hypothetical protein CEXT_202021 [Caerostris extrusa]|uniref:Uncharacterized protein n=1 Tax=Caerostris extrusa TaxID=172846 RepID=A0AAV4NXX5_CAEEX|nr:hypothetical protein CEXT_202021 [Caerostris extrusa]
MTYLPDLKTSAIRVFLTITLKNAASSFASRHLSTFSLVLLLQYPSFSGTPVLLQLRGQTPTHKQSPFLYRIPLHIIVHPTDDFSQSFCLVTCTAHFLRSVQPFVWTFLKSGSKLCGGGLEEQEH